ncbi:hypothetical protein EUTSA_v10011100mg, partial [Eutrema salsugineum]
MSFLSQETVSEDTQLNVKPYGIQYAQVKQGSNKTQCDYGVYALKYIECHARGQDLSLMHDDNINTARMKIACDLFDAANDPVFIDRMS